MNLNLGTYYSIDKCGAVIWNWIDQGVSTRELIHRVKQRYSGDAEFIEKAVADFINELMDQELVKSCNGNEEAAFSDESNHILDSGETFEPPQLHIYNDMKDLLLLDPIHDVDEAGWPSVKAVSNEKG